MTPFRGPTETRTPISAMRRQRTPLVLSARRSGRNRTFSTVDLETTRQPLPRSHTAPATRIALASPHGQWGCLTRCIHGHEFVSLGRVERPQVRLGNAPLGPRAGTTLGLWGERRESNSRCVSHNHVPYQFGYAHHACHRIAGSHASPFFGKERAASPRRRDWTRTSVSMHPKHGRYQLRYSPVRGRRIELRSSDFQSDAESPD